MDDFLTPPLKRLTVTQPFGVDWVGGGFYRSFGMKGHNGIDFRAPVGTPVFACFDGTAYVETDGGYGKNIVLRSPGRRKAFEAVHGHLSEWKVRNGQDVKAGQEIALSGNTGKSFGPHLHFGVRGIEYRDGAGPYVEDYGNGYFGYIDPMGMFLPDDLKMPVEKRYGLKDADRGYSDVEWYKVALWILKRQKSLPTNVQKNALVWGRWDWRTINDPSMHGIWTEMTKPAWLATLNR